MPRPALSRPAMALTAPRQAAAVTLRSQPVTKTTRKPGQRACWPAAGLAVLPDQGLFLNHWPLLQNPCFACQVCRASFAIMTVDTTINRNMHSLLTVTSYHNDTPRPDLTECLWSGAYHPPPRTIHSRFRAACFSCYKSIGIEIEIGDPRDDVRLSSDSCRDCWSFTTRLRPPCRRCSRRRSAERGLMRSRVSRWSSARP